MAILPQISQEIAERTDRTAWRRQQWLAHTLRIHIPEPMYLASEGPKAKPKPKPTLRPRPEPAKAESSQSAAPKQEVRATKRFVLPPEVQRRGTQTLLQPDYPPELLAQEGVRLPDTFFWAPKALPNAPVKPFVMPGHVVRPAGPRALDAPPRLQEADINLTGLFNPGSQSAKLRLPAAPFSMPIQTARRRSGDSPNLPSADPLPGDPSTVLSMSKNPLPLREYFAVPPGNLLADDAENRRGAAPHTAESQRAAMESAEGAFPRPSSGSGTGRGNGPGNGNGAGGSGSGRFGQGTDGGGESGIEAITARALAAAEATRTVHPRDGIFDIVVQSSGVEGFPESAGVLSGKPVYSVFVSVGAGKEWIMQYCIPAADTERPEVSDNVVRLKGSDPIVAPYPQVTLRPLVYRRAGRYVTVHAYITAQGRFADLRLLGAHDQLDTAMIVPVLERWQFRPASVQGRPVRIEVLLAIPGE